MFQAFLLALAGGALIGAAAGLFMVTTGRIAGISGMAGGLVGRWPANWPQTLAFLGGLPAGLLLWQAFSGRAVVVHLTPSNLLLVSAGLLVGIGTRLANGCTSGHAVCGLARLSARSLVATALFMAAAILVVFLRRIAG